MRKVSRCIVVVNILFCSFIGQSKDGGVLTYFFLNIKIGVWLIYGVFLWLIYGVFHKDILRGCLSARWKCAQTPFEAWIFCIDLLFHVYQAIIKDPFVAIWHIGHMGLLPIDL